MPSANLACPARCSTGDTCSIFSRMLYSSSVIVKLKYSGSTSLFWRISNDLSLKETVIPTVDIFSCVTRNWRIMQGHWTPSKAFPRYSKNWMEALSVISFLISKCDFTFKIASGRTNETTPSFRAVFKACSVNTSYDSVFVPRAEVYLKFKQTPSWSVYS